MVALKLVYIANRHKWINTLRLSHTILWSTNLAWLGHFFIVQTQLVLILKTNRAKKNMSKQPYADTVIQTGNLKERVLKNNLK